VIASTSLFTIDFDHIRHIEDAVAVVLPPPPEKQIEQQINAVGQHSNTGFVGCAALLSYLPSAARCGHVNIWKPFMRPTERWSFVWSHA
jgi:hypothetical protein